MQFYHFLKDHLLKTIDNFINQWRNTAFPALSFALLVGLFDGKNGLCLASPADKSDFVLAWETAPRTLDPRMAVDANSQYLEDLVHCSLMTFDREGQLIPQIIESFKWSNPKTLDLTIKANLKFSDGSTLSVDDIVATYQFFINKKTSAKSPRAGAFRDVQEISKQDQRLLRFRLKQADASFLTNLVVGILPVKNQNMTADDFVKSASCGPYYLSSSSNRELNLSRNEQYALGAHSLFKNIIIKIVKDENTRFAKLQTGELDFVQNSLSRDKLNRVAEFPELKVIHGPSLSTTYLGFNMRDPLLRKPSLRQAIALALEKQQIIHYVLHDLAIPAQTILPPTSPFYAQTLRPIVQNKILAAKLLDEAGYPDPDGKGPKTRFELTLSTTTDMTRIIVAKAVAAQLKDIGINVKVAPMEWSRFKSSLEAGAIQLWTSTWIGFKDPDIYRFAFSTTNFPPNGPNRGFYSNAQLDDLLEKGQRELNTTQRFLIYEKVQAIVQAELPYVFLWHEEHFAVMRNNVEGFKIYADGRLHSLVEAYKK